MNTAAELRARFTGRLVEDGIITDPDWRSAFAEVPRELFVPRFFLHKPISGMWAVDSSDPDWLASVYADLTLVTQLDGDDARWDLARAQETITGMPTSSSTQPSLMALMLEALRISSGERVLEVGTGTGYNAALLTHRLGPSGVTSIDVDHDIVGRARERLDNCGHQPTVAIADARDGFIERAPYDGILSTCSWPRIPSPWLAQVRPGGRILSHVYTEFDAGAMVLLTVGPGSASGNFLPSYGAFMPRRDYQRADTLVLLENALRSDHQGARTPTGLLAQEFFADDFSLFAALRVSDIAMHWFQPTNSPTMQTWLLGRDGSWAYQLLEGDELVAVQAGPRRLWSEIESLHEEWVRLGRPERERFGLAVTTQTHTLWLDSPESPHRWKLP